MNISKGKILHEYQEWGLQYTIEFDITVKTLPTSWTNVFVFEKNISNTIYRTPCLNLHPNERLMEFTSFINGARYTFKYDYTLNQNYHVTIKQFTLGDESYMYEIEINGETVDSVENLQARQFSNVTLYASDPTHSPFTSNIGLLENFKANTDAFWSISKNKLVKEYKSWVDVFKVEFDIKVTKLPQETWTNVFRFTANSYRDENYGDRIPALFVNNGGTNNAGFFHVCSAVNGDKNYFKDFAFELGKQYQMTIQQFKDSNGKFWFEIIMDGHGKSIFKIESTQPKSFPNVKLYASDGYAIPFSSDLGKIGNFNIQQGGG